MPARADRIIGLMIDARCGAVYGAVSLSGPHETGMTGCIEMLIGSRDRRGHVPIGCLPATLGKAKAERE